MRQLGGETVALLAEDRARVADDPRLLRSALEAARSPDDQAVPAAALARKVTSRPGRHGCATSSTCSERTAAWWQ